jgi:hypothetical protein
MSIYLSLKWIYFSNFSSFGEKKNVDLIISVCVSHPYDLVILTAAMLKDCHMKVEILKMNSDQLG